MISRIRFPTKFNDLKILLPNIIIYYGKKLLNPVKQFGKTFSGLTLYFVIVEGRPNPIQYCIRYQYHTSWQLSKVKKKLISSVNKKGAKLIKSN